MLHDLLHDKIKINQLAYLKGVEDTESSLITCDDIFRCFIIY